MMCLRRINQFQGANVGKKMAAPNLFVGSAGETYFFQGQTEKIK